MMYAISLLMSEYVLQRATKASQFLSDHSAVPPCHGPNAPLKPCPSLPQQADENGRNDGIGCGNKDECRIKQRLGVQCRVVSMLTGR